MRHLRTRKDLYDIAMAAGADAADRHMRENARKTWNADDYNLMVQEFNRILPEDLDIRLTEPNPYITGWHLGKRGLWYGSKDQPPAR